MLGLQKSRSKFVLRAILLGAATASVLTSDAQAQDGQSRTANTASTTVASKIVVDRAIARVTAPETGGRTKPQLITERIAMFAAELEARTEGSPMEEATSLLPLVLDRLVGDMLLAALLVERGSDPTNLPEERKRLKADWMRNVGGEANLLAARTRHGISEDELDTLIDRRFRAMTYVDRYLEPLMKPTDTALFQAFRTSAHPYRGERFEDAKERFERYFVQDRYRALALDFVRSARNRVRLTYLGALATSNRQGSLARVDGPRK
jgi:hypothetical protein